MSTVHQLSPGGGNFISKVRRRPRITERNRENIDRFFGSQSTVTMSTPKIAADYNEKMNAVDLADQYQSSYALQLRVARVWMPLFFWLLDTTVINAWTLAKISSSKSSYDLQIHRLFRIRLAFSLTAEGYSSLNSTRALELQQIMSTPLPPPHGRYSAGAIPLGNNSRSCHSGLNS
jgi:hypothetical protein